MAGSPPRLAVVIPAYNEGNIIRSTIQGLDKALKKSAYQYKIVVVDDGSTDNTAEQARVANSHVIQHLVNVGSGGATATGLYYASQNNFDLAATFDADGQHNPADLLQGVSTAIKQHVDLMIGSRLINNDGMSRTKRLGNKGLSLITYVLFGINVTDSQSGLRIFSKAALDKLRWRTSGYEFCSEMLWRAKQLNLSISEFPIQAIYTKYSISKGQNNWNSFNIVKALLQRRIMEFFNE